MFQHTAARRRLGFSIGMASTRSMFQHTAARRRLARFYPICSRNSRFNTQPPEGGWVVKKSSGLRPLGFQHTAARRRLDRFIPNSFQISNVSTHSRPKAAGPRAGFLFVQFVSFNTQPPEGGWSLSQKPCSIRFRSPDFAKLTRKARTRV